MSIFDKRPIVVALAGPNGAGKSTFYHAHLAPAGLRFVNADDIARELGLGAYDAADLAEVLRHQLVKSRESFVFETVFSDPKGDKVAFLREVAAAGVTVLLCFIGLPSAALSEERVAMRVMQGGHDVPWDKLAARFPRVLENLARALRELPNVIIYDNSDLGRPYRKLLELREGVLVMKGAALPDWLPTLG
jgi:predicted ABC-type ATPase